MKEKKKLIKLNESEMTLARMAAVASSIAFGVEAEAITDRRRDAERVVMARQPGYWLLKSGGFMSYTKAAAAFGRIAAGTARHGYEKIENELELNLPRGYSQCIREAEEYFSEFRGEHRRKEVARKRKEFENVI